MTRILLLVGLFIATVAVVVIETELAITIDGDKEIWPIILSMVSIVCAYMLLVAAVSGWIADINCDRRWRQRWISDEDYDNEELAKLEKKNEDFLDEQANLQTEVIFTNEGHFRYK